MHVVVVGTIMNILHNMDIHHNQMFGLLDIVPIRIFPIAHINPTYTQDQHMVFELHICL